MIVPAASGSMLMSVRPSCFICDALKDVADGMRLAAGAGLVLVGDVPFLSAWISLYSRWSFAFWRTGSVMPWAMRWGRSSAKNLSSDASKLETDAGPMGGEAGSVGTGEGDVLWVVAALCAVGIG